MYTQRLEKLTRALKTSGMDAVVLNPGPTLTYLTGLNFHLMERPVVMLFSATSEVTLVLPELEKLKAEALTYNASVVSYGENPADWNDVFRKTVSSAGLDGKQIGVEPRRLRLLEYNYIHAAAPKANFPDASDVLASLRICKDADEIAKMQKAVQIAQNALEAALPLVKIGMTEKELASELVVQLLKHGSESEMPFAPIVSSGPNSANPHASPTDRKLQPGDLLVVDWGAAWEGYISDLTRTFAIGEVDAEYQKIHQVVQQANAAGRTAGKPGVPCAAVDKAARGIIEQAGYGQYFTHRTGHGIGMEGHEEPYMRGDNQKLLEVGMAYTVEPGIYLPGRNGVRIEDNMVVTQNGSESLSDMPREIRVLG